ncbi:hypothetical protein AOLI_G00014510 [Acnodon oligacanthus]
MAYKSVIPVSNLDLEHLLLQKVRLNLDGLLDPVLKTNLQFAMAAVDVLPAAMKKKAELLVEGDKMLVKFYSNNQPQLQIVVFQDPEGTKLHLKIRVDRPLEANDIDKAYFTGHSCPHATPCREQAVTSLLYSRNREIKVICEELRLTFSTSEPEETIVVP